jgi:hypothetical protein
MSRSRPLREIKDIQIAYVAPTLGMEIGAEQLQR